MSERGYAAIGFYHPKCLANVGGAFRAAHCYNAKLLLIQGQRYRRASTDTPQAYRHIPLLRGTLKELIPYDCVPVAVDLVPGARSLHSYTHPERAMYIFGPEDSTLGTEILSWCRDVIYIPMQGCSNLAATVNVVLYDRSKKRQREERLLMASAYSPLQQQPEQQPSP